ncbi:MAG: glycoside hydrolase family 16 protein [Saprospiraceae bacterium]|nr:glycoside hydrolase family 16 protein [Pyrinomonadaceae bacterium]
MYKAFTAILLVLLSCDAFAVTYAQRGKYAFRDEFNKPANTPIDSSKWTAEIGGEGWGNKELQYYTNEIENAYHDGNGSLVIKVIKKEPPLLLKCWYGECKFTSARLITKNKFDKKYGRFEARIKIPQGQGIWPAFWMLGSNIDKVNWPNSGEIDIMENIGREPSIVHSTIHGPGYLGANGISASYSLPNQQKFADDFHVYAAEWTENKISFYVDGNLYKTTTPKDLPSGKEWVFNHAFFMILNLAVGGPWGGEPDKATVFPQMMTIDYVRVSSR